MTSRWALAANAEAAGVGGVCAIPVGPDVRRLPARAWGKGSG